MIFKKKIRQVMKHLNPSAQACILGFLCCSILHLVLKHPKSSAYALNLEFLHCNTTSISAKAPRLWWLSIIFRVFMLKHPQISLEAPKFQCLDTFFPVFFFAARSLIITEFNALALYCDAIALCLCFLQFFFKVFPVKTLPSKSILPCSKFIHTSLTF